MAYNHTPSVVDYSYSIGVSVDTSGNIGIQAGRTGSVSASVGVDAGFSYYSSLTNAPTIAKLNGESYQAGVVVNIPAKYVTIHANSNVVSFTDSKDPDTRYWGYTYVGGVSGPSADGVNANGVIGRTVTETVVSINIFDEFDNLYDSVMRW